MRTKQHANTRRTTTGLQTIWCRKMEERRLKIDGLERRGNGEGVSYRYIS